MTQEKHTLEEQPRRSGKPVLIYIMILFIAAFLLMALSFAMHQRSNQQAMGELESSFMATMKDMQADQDKLLVLQDKLSDTENQLQDTQEQLTASETAHFRSASSTAVGFSCAQNAATEARAMPSFTEIAGSTMVN